MVSHHIHQMSTNKFIITIMLKTHKLKRDTSPYINNTETNKSWKPVSQTQMNFVHPLLRDIYTQQEKFRRKETEMPRLTLGVAN